MKKLLIPSSATALVLALASCYPAYPEYPVEPAPPGPRQADTSARDALPGDEKKRQIDEHRRKIEEERRRAEERINNPPNSGNTTNPGTSGFNSGNSGNSGATGNTTSTDTSSPTTTNRSNPTNTHPYATKVPGKDGFVFNPFTQNQVDVTGLSSGTLVRDPYDPNPDHKFRVP